jgi:translation initiation factor IF-3
VNTVKGYATHEKETLEGVVEARSKATQIKVDAADLTPEKLAEYQKAQGAVTSALGKLLAITENYPDLKANQNFLQLQEEIADLENKLSSVRRYFNSATKEYNNAVETFPSNILAGMFGFRKEVMPARKALELARQQELDLVEISPNAQPPVCRIVDYSKFLYQQKKHAKEMKQKQVKVETKEIRFGPQTDEHDYQFKLKHAMEFLNEGNKVRAYVFFRGRSILFKEQGEVLLLRFANDLEEYGKVEQMPKLEGKKMFLYMSPKKAGTAKKSQQKMDREKREAEAKAAADAERAANAEKNGLLANAKGGDALKKLAEGTED